MESDMIFCPQQFFFCFFLINFVGSFPSCTLSLSGRATLALHLCCVGVLNFIQLCIGLLHFNAFVK